MRVGKRERPLIRTRQGEEDAVKARVARVSGGRIGTSLSSLWPHKRGKCRAPSARNFWSPGNSRRGPAT
jgi:hypothetical protein